MAVPAALRADAQRNLSRILDAATEAFAELGPDVSIDEIARRAGVGHGTVFRRFPTKDALRAAVLTAHLDQMVERAQELLERPDAGAAFEEFVWAAAELCRRDRALFEGVEKCIDVDVLGTKAELHQTVDELIRRACADGAIRDGLDAQDVGALVGAAIQATAHAERPDAWRRYIEVFLAGIRP